MDGTQTKELLGSKSTPLTGWITVFVVVGFIVVVVNSLTLYTFIKTPSLKTRKHIMVVNLAVADLFYGAVGIPSAVYFLFKPTLTSFLVSQALNTFSKGACLLTLAVIAVERMHASVWPIRHKVMNERAYKIALVAIWILSAGMTTVLILDRGEFNETFKFAVYVLPITIIALFLIIVACYVCIWIAVRARRQRMHGTMARQDRALARTLLLVTGVFVVTWAFPMFYVSVSIICQSCYHFSGLFLSCFVLLIALQSLTNPIIYCFRLPTFKMGLKLRLQEMRATLCMEPRRRRRSRKVTAETKLANSSTLRSTGYVQA